MIAIILNDAIKIYVNIDFMAVAQYTISIIVITHLLPKFNKIQTLAFIAQINN